MVEQPPAPPTDIDQIKAMEKQKVMMETVNEPPPKQPFPNGGYENEGYNWVLELLEIKNVPQYLVESFWGIINPVHELSKLDKFDIERMDRQVDIITDIYRESIPFYRRDPNIELQINQMKTYARSHFKRGLDGHEREAITKTTKTIEYVDTNQKDMPKTGIRSQGGGWVKRIGGMLGFK